MLAVDLTLVAASSALTTAWHHLHHWHREIRNHREMCNHVWGDLHELGGTATSRMYGRFFYRHCLACGEQQNCNEDGTEYVPVKQRRDEPHDR